MKNIFAILILLIGACLASAQGSGSVSYRYGSSLPTTCSPSNVISFYLISSGTYTPYYCSAVNTWTAFGGAGSGTVNAGTTNQIAYYPGNAAAVSGNSGLSSDGANGLAVVGQVAASQFLPATVNWVRYGTVIGLPQTNGQENEECSAVAYIPKPNELL